MDMVPKAKVKKKKGIMASAKMQEAELPALAQAIEMKEMEKSADMQALPMATANTMGAQPVMTAKPMGESEVPSANMGRAKVKRMSSAPKDADVYDPRIGGYGKSKGPEESGEAAVKRIQSEQKKAKVKRKRS